MNKPLFNLRSWVEIDLNKLINNYSIYRSHLPDNAQIMAVVKANAYGHGDIMVARALQNLGVSLFAVSNIDEAVGLREAGISGEILILGYTPVSLISQLRKYDITQTIISNEYALEFLKSKTDVKCQLAINTGMNRIGLSMKDINECESLIRHYTQHLNVNGVFTHLSSADCLDTQSILFTNKQISLFEQLVQRLSDLNLSYIHCMNSAGGIAFPNKAFGIVRTGIALFGLNPSLSFKLYQGIKPILRWKSIVSDITLIEPGEAVGYGRSYIATKKTRVATITTGYADGYSRLLSNRGFVFINGYKAPIIGKICMDQMMVDTTDIPIVKVNDEVELIGDYYSAEDMAQSIGTISYEVLCNISKRVVRIYK